MTCCFYNIINYTGLDIIIYYINIYMKYLIVVAGIPYGIIYIMVLAEDSGVNIWLMNIFGASMNIIIIFIAWFNIVTQ